MLSAPRSGRFSRVVAWGARLSRLTVRVKAVEFRVGPKQWRLVSTVLALLWILLAVIAFETTRELTRELTMMSHTNEVLSKLSELQARTNDVETAQRGFLITGDPTYLEPQRGAGADIETLLAEVGRLTADNPDQQRIGAELAATLARRIEQSGRVVAARTTQGFDAAQAIVREGTGKRLPDEVRAKLGEMRAHERQLLERRAVSSARQRNLLNVSLAVALVLVGLGLLGSVLLGRICISTEQRLRLSEARYRELFQAAPTPVWVVDQETGAFLFVNQASVAHYG